MERTGADGNRIENPSEYVELDLADGIVLDRVLVERIEPESLHVQETMDEDDDFESIGTEVWEYEIAEGRDQEFIDALKNSKMVMEVEPMDDAGTIGPGTP